MHLRTADLRRRFDRAARSFDTADVVHRSVRDRLLTRLEPIQVDASLVLDAGSATGAALPALATRFRGARVIAVDQSTAMLRRLPGRRRWFRPVAAVCADACRLPFADRSVDVIFANLLLPWIDDPARFFGEAARVLRSGGLLAFSTLGPDSLLGLRRAWQAADAGLHVHRFLDMHDIGDAAVRSGLRDPVLDVDRLTVTYRSPADLFRDLSATGARNSLAGRRRSLTGTRSFAAMTAALDAARTDGLIGIDLELVFGHCWGGGRIAGSGEFRVDADRIPRRS